MNQTRHVAITGAAGGLGHALATTLSNQGCRLSLSDVVANEGTDRKIAVVDVRDAAAMTDWLTACHDEQPIDWLIVNAALGGPAPIGEPFESDVRAADLLAVNTLAAIEQCRVATRLMAGRGGRIILVASLAAVLGNPNAPSMPPRRAPYECSATRSPLDFTEQRSR